MSITRVNFMFEHDKESNTADCTITLRAEVDIDGDNTIHDVAELTEAGWRSIEDWQSDERWEAYHEAGELWDELVKRLASFRRKRLAAERAARLKKGTSRDQR